MHRFPADFDPSRIVGLEVQQIAYAVNLMLVGFHDGSLITVTNGYRYRLPGDLEETVEQPPASSSRLMQIVETRVESCVIEDRCVMTLAFDGGAELRLADDSDYYECLTLCFDGIQVFV